GSARGRKTFAVSSSQWAVGSGQYAEVVKEKKKPAYATALRRTAAYCLLPSAFCILRSFSTETALQPAHATWPQQNTRLWSTYNSLKNQTREPQRQTGRKSKLPTPGSENRVSDWRSESTLRSRSFPSRQSTAAPQSTHRNEASPKTGASKP